MPAVVRRAERLKFLQRLAAEVAAIDQKEDALGAGKLDEAINEVAGGVSLSGAGGHLDQGASAALGE